MPLTPPYKRLIGQVLPIPSGAPQRCGIPESMVNNGQLGKISNEQRAGDWDVWQTSLHNPDFSKYAEICGALGIRVTRAGELNSALSAAIAHRGPALVEVISDPDLI